MTNEYIKMNNEELTQAVGGLDGKVGLDEGPMRTVHGLQTGWLALRSDARYDANTKSDSFTMVILSRSWVTPLSLTMTSTGLPLPLIHGSTQTGSKRAAG